MLEYALHGDSNTLRHVDSVENGLKCNCVCSGCGDRLVAKNNGTSGTRHHFAHDSKDENSNCLMTQLHLVAQHFFLESQPLYLPPASFEYKGQTLSQCEVSTNVRGGKLEVRLDRYIADVLLETELGDIVIEIFVTHENEAEKTTYYQHNKIPSIEFDLSAYLNRNIDEALSDLKAKKVPYKWLYEWCREQLIDKHEQFLEREAERIKKKRVRSAKDSARKFIKGNYILLPSLTQKFECQIDKYTYREEVTIYSRSEQRVDSVSQVKLTEEYLLLKAIRGYSHIWVAFLLKDCLPDDVVDLNGSVVIRTPATSENNRATWKWLKYPKLMLKIERSQQSFLKESNNKAKKARTTKDAVRQAKTNSELYLLSKDNLFKRDYSRWSKWMTLNQLFQPSPARKHPKLPHALNYIRSYPCLWAFDTWHILALSLLAEIVDRKPKDTKIFYHHLFKELVELTGLHKEFSDIEQRIAPHAVDADSKSLVIRSEIIEEALRPYANVGVIYRLEGGFKRIGSLMEAIDLDSYISVNR
ncbi:TPA: hypothetical protein NGS96_001188 [Vibrio parahaemolyticus]|nr:hypothetical protein [Vibrio parahaemolyticus]HCG6401306.1 hypothetical protein [Vibrio parahaemolyticus]HCG9158829.1 hypothetical protein [Vibrio parahaemolyticus]